MSETTYGRSGQYELIQCVIKTKSEESQQIDISGSFVDAVVYESIYDTTMSGHISVVDTGNFIQRAGLGNLESIHLEWKTSGTDESILVEGQVYDLMGPHEVSGHASGFTMHFCSPEFINSIRDKVLNGYLDTSSSIVKRIFSRIQREEPFVQKELIADQTQSIENIVFTGNDPIEAIQLCSRMSCSSTGHLGSIFFENNQEFKFTTLETLYGQDPVIEYVYRNSPVYEDVNNASEESFNVIQDMVLEESNTLLDKIRDGQYGSTFGCVSLDDKRMNMYSFDVDSEFDESKALARSPGPKGGLVNKQHNDSLNLSYTVERSQSEPYAFKNRMKLLQAMNYPVSIGVFGNSTLKAGLVCIANIPNFSSDTGPERFDTLSGKFLIAAIKHVLTPKQYTQRIQITKDSFEETVA